MVYGSGVAAKHSHCSYCGAPFADAPFPRHCPSCSNTTFVNPLPVAVCLVPVEGGGLLTVRRAIEPHVGKLALPGGFIDVGESWQEAAAREVHEETGLLVYAGALTHFAVHSAPDGTLLVFGLAPAIAPAAIPALPPQDEVSELVVIGQPETLAFPLHTRVVADYFAR